MTLVDEFKNNVTVFGTVTDTGNVSDNDPLWTSVYLQMLIEDVSKNPDTSGVFVSEMVRLSEVLQKYIDENGRTKRRPDSDVLDSPDNLVAWVFLSCNLHREWATRILTFVRRNGGMWPGPESEMKRWLGRFKGITAALQLVAGEQLQYDEQFWLSTAILVSAFQTENTQDNFIQGYLLNSVLNDLDKERPLPIPVKMAVKMWEGVKQSRCQTMRSVLSSFGPGWIKFAEHFK